MNTTNEYLDQVAELDRAQGGTGSDYAVANRIGISRQLMSDYRNDRRQASDAICLKIAQALDISPGVVLARVHSEREVSPEVRKVWKSVAEKLSQTAAMVAFAVVTVPALIYSHPALSLENQAVLGCILC